MSKTDKKMREELAEIRRAEESKRLEDDKDKAEMERIKLRENNRADARAARADSLAKGHMMTDPNSQREITLWEYARKKADAALGADVNAYNDWRSAMMGLWNIYSALNHALHQSVAETIVAPIENGITDYLVLPAYDNIIEPLSSKVVNLFTGSDDPEVTLPELRHEVSFTDDNTLKIEPLTRADNVKNTGNGTLDKLFAKGVRMWLGENGYKLVPGESSKFVDVHGKALDKNTFNELKEDPEHGLGTFLRGYSELQLTPRGP